MAAYAAAVSLLETLRRLQQLSNSPNYRKSGIEVLEICLYSLKKFLERNREVKRDFETKIRDAIYEAQDTIDSRISSAQSISPSEAEVCIRSFCGEIDELIHKITSLAEMTTEEFYPQTLDKKIDELVWRTSFDMERRRDYPLLGRDEDLTQVKDRLISESPRLEVVPIVGIAGMGKTALAHCLYYHPLIRDNFHIFGWVRIPTEYNKRDVLLDLLRSMKKLEDEIRQKTDNQLAKHVYNTLKRERYLIVLDDVRDVAVWNDLKELFPDYHCGSRILLTMRNEDLAPAPSHVLKRVSDEDALALLRTMVFYKKQLDDSPQLVLIATDIAERCKGLPHAIVIVGRLLMWADLDCDRIAEYWEIVLSSIKNMSSLTGDYYVDLVEALVSLTYKHLPQQLKAYLLYMAIFPYGYNFSIQTFMHLMDSEGCIENYSEAVGFDDIMFELYDRDLTSITLKTGRISKGMRIREEVFHDFILRKAKEEKFIFVINKDTNYGFWQKDTTSNQCRRLCIHMHIVPFVINGLFEHYKSKTSISGVRALIYSGPEHRYPLRNWLRDFKLLKSLDASKICFYSFPSEILKLIHLRFLALSYNGELPTTVCKLQNLRFLIVLRYCSMKHTGAPSYLPIEIWNMKELEHLQVIGSDLPYPPPDTDLGLQNLARLLGVTSHTCTPRILKKLKNLSRLGIIIKTLSEDESLSYLSNLDICYQIHSFKCVVMYPDIGSEVVRHSFPFRLHHLIELTLSGCGFPWKYMRVIGTLPHLRKLKLRNYALRGPEWEVKANEFTQLNFLLLEDTDLDYWIVDSELCFPMLNCLVVRHCYKLQEFPFLLGSLPRIQLIEVVNCNTSAMNSAQDVKECRSVNFPFDIYSSRDD